MVGMRDVAKKAGVSVSSVSLVVNGTGYVSHDMRERVERAMRELNYVPNELARNFYHGKTGIVGVIVPTIQHPFFATLTAHLQREFTARSLRTMLCSTADSASGEAQYVEMLRQRSLDALVVAAHTTHDTDYWTSIGRPIVAFDRNLGARIAQVSSDHAYGGKLIADLLIRTGARNVAIVGGPRAQFTDLSGSNTTFPTVRYVQTLEKCLSQAGIAHTYAESGEVFDLDGVRRAVHAVFDAHPDIDAFVGADLAAAFAMQEATMREIAVPGQLQIVAYDGTMTADCAGLPLTVARQDFRAIACGIADKIEAEIARFADNARQSMAQAPQPEIVPVALEERATTR
ncbi:LacI family transcriptional regulator [Bifidobacterium pseudolongum subsp. globosum]|uniref:LacI family transcriptional regulator n=1 Tax=Bifidobacterium pseudolongum subsp. globosum TaxID=1690 RepID=A0A2N3QLS2_9BIFI|nr:LacI family DNA-binding transcriptional regulator [Bifidobacterium pseudolongum]PKU92592.1 LacI family transcriptional regulator [Bifidobacterium pseudolongum subsp. globosum]